MWRESVEMRCGDCRDLLPEVPDGSVDAVITDPPYAEVDRPYGRVTESDWHTLMQFVVRECRRALRPSGSMAIVLQPNSERVGRMRTWLWDFLAWAGREWNVVQDFYWWNHAAAPTVHCRREYGLMRPSVKYVVWLGEPDCYRCQDDVLWGQSDASKAQGAGDRALRRRPSGQSVRAGRMNATAAERGGSTPFNLLPIANTNSRTSGGAMGHGAATPKDLCDWWVRYITRPGALVLNPFGGSGTLAASCRDLGRRFLGFERDETYAGMAGIRLAGSTDRLGRHHVQGEMFP